MHYRTLGRTGLNVSEVGFGAWAIGGNEFGNSYGSTDDNESVKAVRKAYTLGCNFFDTADVYGYGRSETLLGQALKDVRDKVYIATKVGGDFYGEFPKPNFSPTYIEFACEQSLQRLQTDYIDLYQLHNPTLGQIKDGKIFEVMEKLKTEGKIRFYGVSIHEPQEGIAAINLGTPDTIQVVYNIFLQKPAAELFPLALEKNVGVIAREPLANGFLTGKYTKDAQFEEGDIRSYWPQQMIEARVEIANALKQYFENGQRTLTQAAIKFSLSEKAVSVSIPGAKTEQHIEENMRASECPLETDEIEWLNYYFRR
jgi:aryl-alcohol dehydrogenase-like predicted oxidoreductase